MNDHIDEERSIYHDAFFELILPLNGGDPISPHLALQDHVNVFLSMTACLSLFKSWQDEDSERSLIDFFNINPYELPLHFETFSEHFPETKYPGLLSRVPQDDLSALDCLAEDANFLIVSNQITVEKLKEIATRGRQLLEKYNFSRFT